MRVKPFYRLAAWCSAVGLAFLVPAPASAELVLSELVVELQPGKQLRDDVEVWNNSPERNFIAVEPREIIDPGLSIQSIRQDPDPEKLGLLVAPARMILEPGQRKLVRMAALSFDPDREHVFRVTIKPVVGGLDTDDSGLKIVVGYDVLVLVRPAHLRPVVTASRKGRQLIFNNSGNVSVEIVDGKQCRNDGSRCTELPGKRLYPGASWTVDLPADLPTGYTLKSPGRVEQRVY